MPDRKEATSAAGEARKAPRYDVDLPAEAVVIDMSTTQAIEYWSCHVRDVSSQGLRLMCVNPP